MSNHGDILRVLKRIEDLLVRIADNIAPAEAEPAPAESGKKPARLFAVVGVWLIVIFALLRTHQVIYAKGLEVVGLTNALLLLPTASILLFILHIRSGLGERDLAIASGETSWAKTKSMCLSVAGEAGYMVGFAFIFMSQFGILVREDYSRASDQAVCGIVFVLAAAILQVLLVWLAAAVGPLCMQWADIAQKDAFTWSGLRGILKVSDPWSDEENRSRQAWALTVPAVVLLVYLYLPFAEVHGYGHNEKLLLLAEILRWALIVYGSMKGLRLSIPIFLDSVWITLLVMVLVSSNFLAWNRWFIAGMVLVVASLVYRIVHVWRSLRSGRQAPGTEADDDETRSQTDA